MSVCISRHGEYSEHTPDAEWTCTLCGEVDTAGLRAEVKRLRDGIEDMLADIQATTTRVYISSVASSLADLLNPTDGETDD